MDAAPRTMFRVDFHNSVVEELPVIRVTERKVATPHPEIAGREVIQSLSTARYSWQKSKMEALHILKGALIVEKAELNKRLKEIQQCVEGVERQIRHCTK